MAFNFKKQSGFPASNPINESLPSQGLVSDIYQKIKQKLEQPSKNQSNYNQDIKDWVEEKVKSTLHHAQEVMRKSVVVDKQKNIQQKYQGGNTSYKNLSNPYKSTKRQDIDPIYLHLRSNQQVLNTDYNSQYESLTNRENLNLNVSKDLKDEIEHFEKQNDKCYYCGRELYSGKFTQDNIHLEHLIDKSRWINEIVEGQKLLIKYFKSGINDENINKDAGFIVSIIESNAVNSLQNWMYADVECNMCKMDLPHFSFIDFMNQIGNIQTSQITKRNKEIYEKFEKENKNFTEISAKDISLQSQAKSFELTLEYLSNLILESNKNLPDHIQAQLHSESGLRPKHAKQKIDGLLILIEQTPELKDIIKKENYKLILNNFQNLAEPGPKNYSRKKIIFATQDKCSCAICGKNIKESSPLNVDSSLVFFDVTEDPTDFQWQLVHSDCAGRCQQFSIKTLRFLAQRIKTYGPEREKITKSLGTDIEKIYKEFSTHLNSLKSFLKQDSADSVEEINSPKTKSNTKKVINEPEKQNLGQGTIDYLISYKNQNNLSMQKLKDYIERNYPQFNINNAMNTIKNKLSLEQPSLALSSIKTQSLLKIADHLDKKKKYQDSDSIVNYMLTLAQSKLGDSEEPEDIDKYLSDLRSSFIDFLSDIVTQDFIKEHGRSNLSPESLVNYYFNNREKYEDDLDNYDLMLGQTEGIMSDDEFINDLKHEHIIDEDGAMKREGI